MGSHRVQVLAGKDSQNLPPPLLTPMPPTTAAAVHHITDLDLVIYRISPSSVDQDNSREVQRQRLQVRLRRQQAQAHRRPPPRNPNLALPVAVARHPMAHHAQLDPQPSVERLLRVSVGFLRARHQEAPAPAPAPAASNRSDRLPRRPRRCWMPRRRRRHLVLDGTVMAQEDWTERALCKIA